jgi:hypothetical protein
LIACVLATPVVSAETKTQTLQAGEYLSLGYQVNAQAELSYTVTVTSGGHIDVLLMDSANYAKFTTGQLFTTLGGGTSLDVASVTKKVTLDPGTYYLVIDNTPYGSAYTGQAVTYSYDVTTSGLNWFNIILIVVVVVAIVLVVVLLLRRRKRRRQAAMNKAPAGYPTIEPGASGPQTKMP